MHKLWITVVTRTDDDQLPALRDTDRFGEEVCFTRSATTISRDYFLGTSCAANMATGGGARSDGTYGRGTIGI